MAFGNRIEEIERIAKITDAHRPHVVGFYKAFERIEELRDRRTGIIASVACIGALITAFMGWESACDRAIGNASEYAVALLFPWVMIQFGMYLAMYGGIGAAIGGIVGFMIAGPTVAPRIAEVSRELKAKLDGDPVAREAFKQLLVTDESARDFVRAHLVDVVI